MQSSRGQLRDNATRESRRYRRQPGALVCFLICAIPCLARGSEDDVLAVYKQMEKAEQSGDADAWIGLWSRASAANAEKIRPYVSPRPDVHYTASTTFVEGDEAALLGQSSLGQFLRMRFVKEDGSWKIKDQLWSETAFHPDSVYAFERAGAPWRSAAPGMSAADAARRGWQVRAIFDESYLYIRIESAMPLPAPGSTADKPPGGWTVMKAGVSGVGEFLVYLSADIGDQATFDQNGRANSHRHFVAYSLRLERGGRMIFQAAAGLDTDPLVQLADHSFEVRVPLRAMGIADAGRAKITLGDAQWPKTAIFSLEAQRYR